MGVAEKRDDSSPNDFETITIGDNIGNPTDSGYPEIISSVPGLFPEEQKQTDQIYTVNQSPDPSKANELKNNAVNNLGKRVASTMVTMVSQPTTKRQKLNNQDLANNGKSPTIAKNNSTDDNSQHERNLDDQTEGHDLPFDSQSVSQKIDATSDVVVGGEGDVRAKAPVDFSELYKEIRSHAGNGEKQKHKEQLNLLVMMSTTVFEDPKGY